MLLIKRKSILKILLAAVSTLGLMLTACSDDEKHPENPVSSVSTDQPASPTGSDADKNGAHFAAEIVYFAFDSANLDDVTQSKLGSLAGHLSKDKAAKLEIAGHCDERGTIEYNLALGERRANSVKKYLTHMGVEDTRISTISYGEERPAVEGHNEAAWSKNRRAEFTLSR